jgi:hypothetical protein
MHGFFKDMSNWFIGSPIFNMVSLILAIVGLIFTFYFYYKSKKNRKPTYVIRTINLVRKNIKKIETVEILYSGRRIENLSMTKIALWNDGKETINAIDVAISNPIRIDIDEEFEILESEILFQKNLANDFRINISHDKKSLLVNFDYFDYEEGIVLQISHTANSSASLKIEGAIKAVKKIVRKKIARINLPSALTEVVKLKTRHALLLFGWLFVIMGSLMSISFFYQSYSDISPNTYRPPFLEGCLIGVLMGIPYFWFGFRLLRRRIPRGFDIFNDEF